MHAIKLHYMPISRQGPCSRPESRRPEDRLHENVKASSDEKPVPYYTTRPPPVERALCEVVIKRFACAFSAGVVGHEIEHLGDN